MAPELVHVMQKLSAVWPSQSGVERANGVLRFATGAVNRAPMQHTTRMHHAMVADWYSKEHLARPFKVFKKMTGSITLPQTALNEWESEDDASELSGEDVQLSEEVRNDLDKDDSEMDAWSVGSDVSSSSGSSMSD